MLDHPSYSRLGFGVAAGPSNGCLLVLGFSGD
jgi:hypothetical protein